MQSQAQQNEIDVIEEHYATERRRQLTVLLVIAAVVLVVAVLLAGIHNVFLPGWWHIDLP